MADILFCVEGGLFPGKNLLVARLKDEAGHTSALVGSNIGSNGFVFDLSSEGLNINLTDAQVREAIGTAAVAKIERMVEDADKTPLECEPLARLMRPGMTAKHEDWKKNHRESDIKANAEFEARRGGSQPDTSQVWPKITNAPQEMEFEHPPANKDAVVIDKLDARGMGIRVTNCGACDGTHDDLKVNEYARPLGPFTHWFMCPTLHDPVNLTLAMLKTGDGLELDGPVCRKLAEAQIAGRWMVIICYVDSSGGADALKYQRNGHKFPSGDVYPSKQSKGLVGLLMEDLEREFGPAQPVEMKKVEPHPLKSLMGRAENAVQNSLGDRVSEAMHPMPPQ